MKKNTGIASLEVAVMFAVGIKTGIYGIGNRLPWHIPEEIELFRKTTLGYAVIMGRGTYLSIPEKFRPLKRRQNIVVTKNKNFESSLVDAAGSLEEAFSKVTGHKVFVIGGAELVCEAICYTDEFSLTRVFSEDYYGPYNRGEKVFYSDELLHPQQYFPDFYFSGSVVTKRGEKMLFARDTYRRGSPMDVVSVSQ